MIEKVKHEREGQRPLHPSALKVLKRNQIIRKRYAQAANALLQQAKTATYPNVKTKFERASQVLERYAKTLPLETNRGDKLHQQIDQKLNGVKPQSQVQLDTLKALNAERLHLGLRDNRYDLDYELDD